MSKRVLKFVVLLAVLSLALVACTGTNNTANTDMADNNMADNNAANDDMADNNAADNNAAADDDAANDNAADDDMADDDMDSGTTITFWHVYGEGDPRNDTITGIVEEFNATNEYGITVEAYDQGQHSDIQDKVNAGLTSGDLPNIAVAYTSSFLDWASVDAVVDMNQYIEDAEIGMTQEELDAIYPGIFADGIAPTGERLAWPMSHSANVMTYNYTWAQELGFDAAPTNAAELKEQLCAAAAANAADDNPDNDGTGGMVWYPSASNYLSLAYAFGANELNEDGTAYDFTDQAFIDAAMYINDLKAEGCTFETESYPNPEQAQRLALVTLSSTAGLPYYTAAFEDVGNEDEWGFLPFLGPDGNQATDFFTQSVGILTATPDQDRAAWIFIKFFTNAENQAKWIEASGYLPTQTTTEPLLVDYVASEPKYQSALDLAALGVAEPQTFPAWSSVRGAVDNASALMYDPALDEAGVLAILEQLNIEAAEFVEEIQ